MKGGAQKPIMFASQNPKSAELLRMAELLDKESRRVGLESAVQTTLLPPTEEARVQSMLERYRCLARTKGSKSRQTSEEEELDRWSFNGFGLTVNLAVVNFRASVDSDASGEENESPVESIHIKYYSGGDKVVEFFAERGPGMYWDSSWINTQSAVAQS
ncbi:MAG: hypothetical protein M1504_03890 [Candidatus Marsarchaeota archaeon]|nr:hypothetical protein [Candidatus Marsarchaeota archaeon]